MREVWRLSAAVVWAAVAAGAFVREVARNDTLQITDRTPRRAVAEAAATERWSLALQHKVREYDPFARPDGGAAADARATPNQPFPIAQFTPVNSRLQLSAIAGPPWRAIVASEGPNAAFIALQVGDTVRGSRVIRISADSIVLRRSGSISRHAVGESWAP